MSKTSEHPAQRATLKAMLTALVGYSAFACSDAAAKWLTQFYPVYQVIVVDCGIAALILLACSPFLGGIKGLRDGANFRVHGLRSLINFLLNLGFVYCLTQMPLAAIYTAVFSKPFFAALLAVPLFGQTIGKHRIIAIAIGFSGIILAFRPWGTGIDIFTFLFLIGLTVLIALMFLSSRWLKNSAPIAIAFYPIALTCIMTLPLALPSLVAIEPWHLVGFAASGIGMPVGLLLVSQAFRMADSAAVSPMMYPEMLWGIFFGWALFGDLPDVWMLGGSALIIASGIYLVSRESRSRAQ